MASEESLRRWTYLIEGIVPAHYPTDVAQHFEYASADHGNCETDEAPREGCLQDKTAKGKGK